MRDDRRKLEELRGELAACDRALVELLDRRARASRGIGELRRATDQPLGLDAGGALGAGHLEELARGGGGELPAEAVKDVLVAVRAASRPLEDDPVVVVLGEADGPSHLAARSRFGRLARFVHVDSAAEAVTAVAERRADFAVVPYETRVDGPVPETLDALVASELRIVGCYEAASSLALVGRPRSDDAPDSGAAERVHGTAADLASARKTLGRHEPNAVLVEAPSVRAACEAARAEPGGFALAPEVVAAEVGLVTRRAGVRDTPDDRTRWAILGPRPSPRTGADRTALLLGVKDAPGALHEVLHLFAERGLNLTNIHSRPWTGGPRGGTDDWRYLFFVEVEGHPTDRSLVSALEDARKTTQFLRVPGSYALD